MRKISILKGAAILTIASLTSRVLGFVYRIYMVNKIGAEGVGLYQLIFPIYMLAWSLSSSGFSTSISKICSAENAKGEFGNSKFLLKKALFISTAISILLSFLMYFFADFLAVSIVRDERTMLPFKILAFAFPFMSMGSCLRGYFHGMHNNKVPAVSQIVEQIVRVLSVVLILDFFTPFGIVYSCVAAVIGIFMGEVVSFAYVYSMFKKTMKHGRRQQKARSISSQKALKMILKMSVPLTANRVTASLLSTVENILIPQMLIIYGLSRTNAILSYGQIMGMALPLIQFPTAILFSLSTTLVPVVSEAVAVQEYKAVKKTIGKTLTYTSIIGFAASLLFLIFPFELSRLIFGDKTIGSLLLKSAVICPLLYTHIITTGFLNGLGEQMYIFKNNIIVSTTNIFFLLLLMPKYGLEVFIYAWAVCLTISLFFEIRRIIFRTQLEINFANLLLKPVSASIFAGSIAMFLKTYFQHALPTLTGLVLIILLMYIVFFLYLVFTKCILTSDLLIVFEGFKSRRRKK